MTIFLTQKAYECKFPLFKKWKSTLAFLNIENETYAPLLTGLLS